MFSDRVVVLVVDRVDVEDLPSENTPFLTGLARRWSVGMMVTRTAERQTGREPDLGAEYVTLGAGVRSRGAPESRLSFNPSERPSGFGGAATAGELYRSFTGMRAPESGVVCLGFEQVMSSNDANGTGWAPGSLGRLLVEGGIASAVIGNCDSLQEEVRLSPLLCCDDAGAVRLGDVSLDTAEPKPDSPGGFRTDFPRLLERSADMLERSDFLVVDTGETGRIDRESDSTGAGVLEAERDEALEEVDRFARDLSRMLDLDTSLLMVVSPGAPAASREEGDYLTPFIAAGRGFERGLLTSGSARRPGLVNNVDLLPTVLAHFDLAVESRVVGSVMRTVEADGDRTEYLKELNAQLTATRKARWPIVITCAALVLLTVCLALLLFFQAHKGRELTVGRARAARLAGAAAVVLLAAPLSLLAVSAFRYDGYAFPVLFCAGFTVVVGLGARALTRRRPRMDPVVSLCLLTAAVMVVDVAFGGRLVMLPLLGGSALEGMRIYGLTNALVGLLIATSVWGVSGLLGNSLLERPAARRGALALLLVLSFVIGFGTLGANAGGFITAVATSLTFYVATSRKGFTVARVGAVAGAVAGATAALILVDSLFVRTHAGKVVTSGTGSFLPLVERKLAIQLGDISVFLVPALVLIAAVVAMALWLRRPGSFWTVRWKDEKVQTATLFSLVVGGLVALVFNDTGAAMLGVMAGITALAMSYYLMRELELKSGSGPDLTRDPRAQPLA